MKFITDNGAFYARKEVYMASQEGIGRTYTCMCHRANGQAVCVDAKLLGTTEGLSQTSANFGCMHHVHMMRWQRHSDLCEFWICEGVIYHTLDGISSPMTNYDSPVSFLRFPLFLL
jgi:hypothetical protein